MLAPSYLADATTAQVTFASRPSGATGYGCYWWIHNGFFAAFGHAG